MDRFERSFNWQIHEYISDQHAFQNLDSKSLCFTEMDIFPNFFGSLFLADKKLLKWNKKIEH